LYKEGGRGLYREKAPGLNHRGSRQRGYNCKSETRGSRTGLKEGSRHKPQGKATKSKKMQDQSGPGMLDRKKRSKKGGSRSSREKEGYAVQSGIERKERDHYDGSRGKRKKNQRTRKKGIRSLGKRKENKPLTNDSSARIFPALSKREAKRGRYGRRSG